jgi:hypothetical protein
MQCGCLHGLMVVDFLKEGSLREPVLSRWELGDTVVRVSTA